MSQENFDELERELKAEYISRVEGGLENKNSILGLAQQIQYAVLPDLFLQTHKNPNESDYDFKERVQGMKKDFNPEVVDKLYETLTDFYDWKKTNLEMPLAELEEVYRSMAEGTARLNKGVGKLLDSTTKANKILEEKLLDDTQDQE